MNDENTLNLYKHHPNIFPETSNVRTEGFRCGDGWYILLHKLCNSIDFETEIHGTRPVVAVQVKDKFGGLRFYTDHAPSDRIRGFIAFAEILSYNVCQNCAKLNTSSTCEECT